MFCVNRNNLTIKHDYREHIVGSMENMTIANDSSDSIFIAFARVYSGTLKSDTEIYVLGPKHDPRKLK